MRENVVLELEESPVLTPDAPSPLERNIPRSALVMSAKRTVDVVGALFFFCLFGLLYLAVWAGVLWTTGRPGIYRHKRVGLHGAEFDCLKFRSMLPNSDAVLAELLASDPAAKAEWEQNFKLKNDPRVTKFGRFIRKTSLDELPQFWNVLRGDMSLVGPRPVVRKELDNFYGMSARVYEKVKPGITGPWQVGGRSHLSYPERIALDCHYATSWSVAGDFRILWKTVKVVLTGHGSY